MSKTTVKITGTEQVKKSTTAFLKTLVDDDLILNELGQLTADQIRARVRSKGRVDDEYKQPDITKGTIEARKRLIKAGNAFNQTIVKKQYSNLSMSGQLLDAIKYKISKVNGQVSLYIERFRRPYKGLRKAELENKSDNIQIKKDLESRGFEFFFISTKLQILLENKIAQSIRRKLATFNAIIRK